MEITIEGMHSPACLGRLRLALENIEGLQVREVMPGRALVNGDARQLAAALAAIELAGFQPHIKA